MKKFVRSLWNNEGAGHRGICSDAGSDSVIVVGTIRLIGSNANNVFSSVGRAIQ